MDRRSWPWKKKSSEKAVTTTDLISESLSTSVGNHADQDNTKGASHVQISAESYAHLTELEDHVKDLNEKLALAHENLSSAHENLSSAQLEITDKDILVKQHAKVAEEAVSGWEKAEAEALALKHELEMVTLLKLTSEEKVSHLDGALKECMRQIRNVKEESERKLQDVIFAKTKQWEKIDVELQAKIADFEQELRRASAENAAISRSLKERSNMLIKISEEKSQADAEIEVLKNNIQSREKELNSLEYELHVVSKELEIRNEERNMSMRSAEVVNKQHLEDVKKITKLESECQRLRGLVRKKLPGPAALAQMKVEVENLGRDYEESRMRRSPARGSSPCRLSVSDFAFKNIQQCHKENEFLTARLLATEEETKMLKEVLSKRNSELQASRNLCAKTVNKLHNIEAHIISFNQGKSPSKPNFNVHFENQSNPPSLTSMSEDGIDEEGSCSESWPTVLISELSQFKKDKGVDKDTKAGNLEVMDDFLEMERLACLSTKSNENIALSISMQDKMITANEDATSLVDVPGIEGGKEQQSGLEPPTNNVSCNEELPAREFTSNILLLKLQSRIASLFESQAQDSDVAKILGDIRCILQDTQEELPNHSVSCGIEETHSLTTCEQNHHDEATGNITIAGVYLEPGIRSHTDANFPLDQELKNAISQIYDFIVSLGKEAVEIQDLSYDDHALRTKIDELSSSLNRILCNELGLHDFVLALSRILSEATELGSKLFGDKQKEGDINTSECIDKVTLSENKIVRHEPTKDRLLGACSSSDLEIDGAICQEIELKTTMQKYSQEEFEQLKMEKESMLMELSCCTKMLEETKQKLVETEQQLTEIKSKLAASEKSNSLAETQLKCMAESYKSLELRTQELELHTQNLEAEINVLHMKAEMLDNELQEERHTHQVDLAKYNELQEKIIRDEKSSMCSFLPDTDVEIQTKKEKEIAAATERLAECQETILLLGRQLQAMRPPEESLCSSPTNRRRMSDCTLEDLQGISASRNLYHDETENTDGYVTQRTGGESPLDGYNSHLSPSDTEVGLRSPMNSKRQKHRLSGSSPSSSPNTLSEKNGRGFSRFFSKGRKE